MNKGLLVKKSTLWPLWYPYLSMHSILLCANYPIDFEAVSGHQKLTPFGNILGLVWQNHSRKMWYQRSRQLLNMSPRHVAVRRGSNRCGRGYSGSASARWHRRDSRNTSQGLRPGSRSASTHRYGSAVPTVPTAGAAAPCHVRIPRTDKQPKGIPNYIEVSPFAILSQRPSGLGGCRCLSSGACP